MYAELLDILMEDRRRDLVSWAHVLKALEQVQAEQKAQREILNAILAAVTLPPATSLVMTLVIGGKVYTGDKIVAKVAMNMKGTAVVDLNGLVDGTPTWTPDVEGVCTLTPSQDGKSCEIVTLPPPEDDAIHTVTITFEADRDLGDGVESLIGTIALTVYDPSKGATIAEIHLSEFVPVDAPPTP